MSRRRTVERTLDAAAADADDQDARLARLFFLNDAHLTEPGTEIAYGATDGRLEWAFACAAGAGAIEPPDVILSGGDLIHGRNFDAELDQLGRMARRPDMPPLLPCVGNHENDQGEGEPNHNEAYDRHLGPGWHEYCFTLGGVGFIVIDTSDAHRSPDAVTDRRGSFLRRAMAHLVGLPLVVVSHVPLTAMREPDVLADRLDVQMHPVPEEMWEPGGNIHGRPRHDRDFTDSDHPTPERYVWGNADEQQRIIPLPDTGARATEATDPPQLIVKHETAEGRWRPVAPPAW